MLKRWQSNERGTITIMAAMFMIVAVGAAGFAVDFGAAYAERRRVQGAVDLAAIVAAADITHADRAARATIAANGLTGSQKINVVLGHYNADPAVDPQKRFVADRLPFNAVSVSLEKSRHFYFAKAFGIGSAPLRVSAVATTSALGAFSVGSRLLALRDGLPNLLLEALLGGSVELSIADYEALANASVTAGSFLDALATELNLTAGTYSDVLNANASIGQVLSAAAKAVETSGDTSALIVLRHLASQSSTSLTFPVKALLDLGPIANAQLGSEAPGLDAMVSLLDVVTTSAVVANGEHQVALATGADIPGLLSLKASLAIGERAQTSGWMAIGEPGASVKTAQIRLQLVAEIGGSGLLAGLKIKLPIAVELARAEGRLANVSCHADGSREAEVAVIPSVAKVWLGEFDHKMDDFSSPAEVKQVTLVHAPLLKIKGLGEVEIGSRTETSLVFDADDVEAGTIKRAEAQDLVGSLVGTLLDNTDLKVELAGLGVPLLLKNALTSILVQAAGPLDAVLENLLATLGLHIGEADVRMHGIMCRGSVLTG